MLGTVYLNHSVTLFTINHKSCNTSRTYYYNPSTTHHQFQSHQPLLTTNANISHTFNHTKTCVHSAGRRSVLPSRKGILISHVTCQPHRNNSHEHIVFRWLAFLQFSFVIYGTDISDIWPTHLRCCVLLCCVVDTSSVERVE